LSRWSLRERIGQAVARCFIAVAEPLDYYHGRVIVYLLGNIVRLNLLRP
jgi:hypothetical protein